MAEITNPQYPTIGGDAGNWGAKVNALLQALIAQGNTQEQALAIIQETIRDTIGTALSPGAGVTIGVDDAGDKIVIGVTAAGGSAATATPKLTRSGNQLQVGGVTKRFGGINAYWLGLDDNNGGSSNGGPGTFPSHAAIASAMAGMRQIGVGLARAHTIGMSAGTSNSFEPSAGKFDGSALDSADWAIHEAKRNGIYLMCPLVDNWNYYHLGKGVFTQWAWQQNPDGLVSTPGTTKDDPNEREFFRNTAGGLRIRALFKAYITAWLNHVNPYTGLAYKDDPTIAIVETGNELYYAAQLGTNEWTQDIAQHIKSIAPDKLVADGSAADRVAVSSQPGLTASAVDILGAHYYPQQQSGSYPPVQFNDSSAGYPAGTALQQLAADATAAKNAGKVFIVGEYPWTRSTVGPWYSAVEGNTDIAASMPWAFVANNDAGSPLVHGGAFGSDDFPVHRPYSGSNELQYAPALTAHLKNLTGLKG